MDAPGAVGATDARGADGARYADGASGATDAKGAEGAAGAPSGAGAGPERWTLIVDGRDRFQDSVIQWGSCGADRSRIRNCGVGIVAGQFEADPVGVGAELGFAPGVAMASPRMDGISAASSCGSGVAAPVTRGG